MRGQYFMQTSGTGTPLDQLLDRVGTVALLTVAIGAMAILAGALLGYGIDRILHTWGTHLVDPSTGELSPFRARAFSDLVAVPLAATAAAWLRWGADWIAAPRAPRATRAGPRWGEESTPPPQASSAGSVFPLLGAAVLFGVICYWGWWWYNPHHLFGIHPQFGVQRWIDVALLSGVGYVGMILFPRLTAWVAGAIAGPALFAVVGYTLFPSFMGAASNLNTITDTEERLADLLVVVCLWGALAVAIVAIITMLLSKRLRERPLSYAIWMGALMICLAASGTFSTAYFGR